MTTLTIHYDKNSVFCILEYRFNKVFHNLIKFGIKPTSYRVFDATRKTWRVHINRMSSVVSFGKKCFDYVDYSQLPEDIQIQIVQQIKDNSVYMSKSLHKTPHAVLFLLPDAPMEIVKAAYKAAAKMYHPDCGGDEEKFKLVQEAYDAIINEN